MFASYGNKKYGGNHWYCIGAPQRRKNKNGSRINRKPFWYFQSKLLVSYAANDNMTEAQCQ